MTKLILASLFAALAGCSPIGEQGEITYRIVDDEIRVRGGEATFDVVVEVQNTTDRNYILYSFRRTFSAAISDSLLCAEPSGAGNAIGITDELGNGVTVEFSKAVGAHDRGDYLQNPVTEDMLQRVFATTAAGYSEGKLIGKAGEKLQLRLTINRKNDPPLSALKPGVYRMFLTYFSGDDLTQQRDKGVLSFAFLDSATMRSDVLEFRAMVFRGCIRTNSVRFVVE